MCESFNKYIIKYKNKPSWNTKNIINKKINSMCKVGIIDNYPLYNSINPKNIKEKQNFSDDKEIIVEQKRLHTTLTSQIICDIEPCSNLYIAKVINDSTGETFEATIIRSIMWLVKKNVNISLGFRRNCSGNCLLSKFIRKVYEKYGIIFISSAGNNDNGVPENKKYITCPGCSPYTITVGGLNKQLKIDKNLNLKNDFVKSKPDVFENGHISYRNKFMKQEKSIGGTSFSAPIVSGIISRYFYVRNSNKKPKTLRSIKDFVNGFH